MLEVANNIINEKPKIAHTIEQFQKSKRKIVERWQYQYP
jgi:hypothetical protein